MIKRIMFLFFILSILIPNGVYATEEIISSQLESLNLSSFISEGKKYTKDTFEDLDIDELLKSAMTGQIDKTSLYKSILSLLGEEISTAVTLLGSILIIIVIHSILKNIGENVGNNSVSQITYYVQYILIVTLIMSNFSEIIGSVKEAITNLIGFINTLIPILLALIMTGRSCSFSNCSSAINSIFYSFCRKYNYFINITNSNVCNCLRNCFEHIRQSSN